MRRCKTNDATYMRTPQQQSKRRETGLAVEWIVRSDLLMKFPSGNVIKSSPSEGIDLTISDGRVFLVEVKSANRYMREGGRKRSGRFYLKKDDYTSSHIIAFAVKEVDINFNWDSTRPLDVHYVKTCSVQDYLKERGTFGRDVVKIVVSDVEKMEQVDFSGLEQNEDIEKCKSE
jgi:hypothetical protein